MQLIELSGDLARVSLPLTPWRVALGGGAVWVTGYRVVDRRDGSSTGATVMRVNPRTNCIVARIRLGTRASDGIHRQSWFGLGGRSTIAIVCSP